jgi:uncharacterized membrane protein
MTRLTSLRRTEWLVPALLVGLALVPSAAGVARVAEVASGATVTTANARFLAMPLPVILHILAAVPFGILGAFQFSPAWRRQHPRSHRAAGRLLVPLALVAAMSGLWMTLTYPWPANDGIAVYLMRLFFGSAMVGAVALGVHAILRRDFASHGAWMTRAYAIGMGAGTQVFTHLPWLILVGEPSEAPRAVMMGAGWVINVIVAELVIRRHVQDRIMTRPTEARVGFRDLATERMR